MSPATAALRIAPIAPAVDTLESAIRTNASPGEIASRVLDAAAALVPCSGGALLLASPTSERLSVAATTASRKYALGKRLKNSFRAPAGSQLIPLTTGGEEFGHILLLDAKSATGDRKQVLDRVVTLAAILRPMVEAEAARHRLTESNAIVEVGQVLTGLLAMDDVLSYVVCVARHGGDEFLVVLPDTPAEGAVMVAQRLLDPVKKLSVGGKKAKVKLELSVGCAARVPLSDGPNFNLLGTELIDRAATALVQGADASLYKTKHSGKPGAPEVVSWPLILPVEENAAA